MQYFRRHHNKRFFRLIALSCALFYVVAACRAIVPELCETQAQALHAAQAESHGQELRALSSCCTLPGFGGSPASLPSGQAPSCAFCNLAKAYTETLQAFVLPLPSDLPTMQPAEAVDGKGLFGFSQTPPARAPPRPLPTQV